jgi:hypothetical protein
MVKKYIIYIAFFIFSVIYPFFLFSQFPNNKFLFIGDQLFRFSKEETYESAFYIRKLENFGVFNAWQLTVQTPEVLYYSAVYNLGLSPRQAEQFLFTLILFITLSLSYYGFTKLREIFSPKASEYLVLAIAIWYSINPYLMVLWHGATYNFGSSLTYSLAPLILYFFHKSITDMNAGRSRLICAVLMFLASFTFWMFAAYAFFLVAYFVCYLIFNKEKIGTAIINVLKLALLYLPLCAIIIFPIVHEYFNNKADINGSFAPMFSQIKGGMLYQFLMYFSWGIYNFWTPRSIYPENVTNFYSSPFYIVATLSLYGLLLVPLINKFRTHKDEEFSDLAKRNYFAIIFGLIFVVSIFLGKGADAPFGAVFMFLYNHVPFFSVFRSSDYRFGFSSVFALSMLMLVLLPHIKRTKYVLITLGLIIFVQNYIFFDTSLIIGQNKGDDFVDRVITIPQDYTELKNFFDNDNETSYIYADPSVEFGTFKLGEDEKHIGQDLLPKLIDQPLSYIPVTSGMAIPTAQVLFTALKAKQYELFSLLPIKYLIIRNDTVCTDCVLTTTEDLDKNFSQVFSNNTFKVYEIPNHVPLVNTNNQTQVTYSIDSPTKFSVNLKNISEPTLLSLMQSSSSKWDIYLNKYTDTLCENSAQINATTSQCNRTKNLINFSDAMLPSDKKLSARAYPENLPHMNSWAIDPATIAASADPSYYQKNSDGTYNLSLTIFYTPQTTYIRYFILSGLLFATYIVLIFFNDKYFKLKL